MYTILWWIHASVHESTIVFFMNRYCDIMILEMDWRHDDSIE